MAVKCSPPTLPNLYCRDVGRDLSGDQVSLSPESPVPEHYGCRDADRLIRHDGKDGGWVRVFHPSPLFFFAGDERWNG